ncbi:MAG: hypothetical protein ACREJB_14855, partial [Planctomycetaceae bacterium]
NFSGTDTLSVVTSDLGNAGRGGILMAHSDIAIRIRSAQEQARELASSIETLVGTGVIRGAAARSLTAKLKFRNPRSAVGRMKAFVNKVAALVRTGRLSPEAAQPLLDSADTLRTSLTTDADALGSGRGDTSTAAHDQVFADFESNFDPFAGRTVGRSAKKGRKAR